MDVLAKLLLEVGWLKFSLFLLLGVSAYAAVQWIKQYKFNKDAEKNGIKVGNESDLRYHTLFASGNYRLAIELPNLEVFVNKPVRQQLVVDLLRSYFSAIIDGCTEITTADMKSWSAEQWTVEMTNRFSAIISAATAKARMEGIPEIAITRFARWINPSIEMLFTYIKGIGSSNVYASNIVKTNTLFMIVNLLMTTMLGDAERSIQSLNGDITGKIYKGQVIEELEH